MMRPIFLKIQDHVSFVFILNTLIGNETKHVVLLNVFMELEFENPIMIFNRINTHNNMDPFWGGRPEVYVLNITSTNLKDIMRKIARSFNYNPHARLIFLQEDDNDFNYAAELSKYFVSSTDIIKIGKQFFEGVTSTYSDSSSQYPVYDRKQITYAFEDHLEEWRRSGFTICFIDESVPPYSLYTVCRNCSRNYGLGFDTADMVLQRFNITRLDLVLPGEDLSTENLKNWLISGSCDMVLSPLTIIDDGLLDFIFPINDDELIWFVPRPSKVPKWKYITKVFSLRFWVIWMLTVFISALFWCVGRGINLIGPSQCLSSIIPTQIMKKLFVFSIQKFIFTTQLFLEQGKAPSGKYLFQITFMVIVILPTLIFNMAYKTGFTSLLLGPDFFEDTIKSLEDIIDHGLFVSFAEWRLSAFDGSSANVKNYFKAHNTPCESISFCVKRMNTSRDLALLMSIENIRYDFERFLDENGHAVIAPIYPRFVKPLYGSVLVKGNPFTEIMNQYNIRLGDHGFIAFILSKYNRKYYKLGASEDKQLTIEHLWGAFFILICGIFIGFISFLVESIVAFLRYRANSRNFNELSLYKDESEIL